MFLITLFFLIEEPKKKQKNSRCVPFILIRMSCRCSTIPQNYLVLSSIQDKYFQHGQYVSVFWNRFVFSLPCINLRYILFRCVSAMRYVRIVWMIYVAITAITSEVYTEKHGM